MLDSNYPGTFDQPIPIHDEDRSKLKRQFEADLDKVISQVKSFHNSLRDDYNAYALEKCETYMYDVGSWFNRIQLKNHPYHDWIWGSETSQSQLSSVVEKATQAAESFQEARRNGYKRATCKRSVENLTFTIENLKIFNYFRSGR